MEDILDKREQKLIKEGLNFIDSFEEYTSKNNPDIYKKYLDLKEEKLISFSDKWSKYMRILEYTKDYLVKIMDFNTLEFDDMIKEMEVYINTLKPKVFLNREDLDKINDIVIIINKISKLPDQSRLNYVLKCITFLRIKEYVTNRVI